MKLGGVARGLLCNLLGEVYDKSGLTAALDGLSPSRDYAKLCKPGIFPEEVLEIVKAANGQGWVGALCDLIRERTDRPDLLDRLRELEALPPDTAGVQALPAATMQELEEAFTESYKTISDLKRLFLYTQQISLAKHIAGLESRPCEEVIFTMLFELEGLDDWPRRIVREAARKKPAVERVARQLGWLEASAVTTEAAVLPEPKLHDFFGDENVREVLLRVRDYLKESAERIREVADSKDLHDALHRLQHEGVNPLGELQRRFAAPGTVFELGRHKRTVERVGQEIRQLLQRPALCDSPAVDLQQSLDSGLRWLQQAENSGEASALKAGWNELRQMLGLMLPLANQMIIQGMRTLPLPRLISEFRRVGEPVPPRFREWLQNLEQVNAGLANKISTHRLWQTIDNGLRLLEVTMERPAEEIKSAWLTISAPLGKACQTPADWSGFGELREQIQMASGLFEEKLAAADLLAMQHLMLELWTLSGQRFVQVDRQLKEACSPLREIGSQLESALEAAA